MLFLEVAVCSNYPIGSVESRVLRLAPRGYSLRCGMIVSGTTRASNFQAVFRRVSCKCLVSIFSCLGQGLSFAFESESKLPCFGNFRNC